MADETNPASFLRSDWKWSPKEKVVARRAFDLALKRELDFLVHATRERTERISGAADLWELEGWLADQHRRIDRTFDFRYSVLPMVFATLLRDGRIKEVDLLGVAPDKLATIIQIARG